MPVHSGQAGFGGILVMTMLYLALNVPLDVNRTLDQIPPLGTVFDLDSNP